MKKILFISSFLFIIVFFISSLTTFVVYSHSNFSTSSTEYYLSSAQYSWPLPDYNTISSYFGYRISPITGLPSKHSGIDIPAPVGTNIYSSISGKVKYLGFSGANGYTITIENSNIEFSYSHISPEFIVNIGDLINKNQIIAYVGPKYIDEIENNPYKDSFGRQTNGSTTGCHLHLSVKIDGKTIDPLTLFN